MARYLLTGAAGFIGSKVAEQLLAAGHEVVAVDNLNSSYDVRLKEWRLSRLRGHEGFEFHQADIRDRAAIAPLFQNGPTAGVINLAARAGVRSSLKDPWAYAETNIEGALTLLDFCRDHGVPKFVQASTSSIYGGHNPRPFHETADMGRPLSPYAATKAAAELLCHSYHHLYDLDVTVLRYFTVYGPAGRPDMSIFRFIQWVAEGRPVRIYGNGKQERDFTFVEDIARGTVAALRPLGFEIINLGSDRPLALLQVLERIESLLDRKAHLEFGPGFPTDVEATWADISKAGSMLGWEPQIDLDQGLAACVEWYLAEREWASQIDTTD